MSEAGHWIAQVGNYSFNMDTLVTMWTAMAFLIIFALIATRKLTLIPSKIQAFSESLMGFFWDLTDSMIGKEGRKHIPLVASLFLFIITANLMGQLPLRLIQLKQGELASPTNDINMTAAMAIIVLVYYVFTGVKKKGPKYFLHGFDFISIILALVEVLDMFTRPLTLALRLFANILAGEILVSALLGMCAYFLPLPIMFFEVLVACIQAMVFMMLTIAYIAMAVEEPEHH
ncbi:MAG TPA: F0F1 ATP synthase subunit A [Candidatus Gastranaerophilaceae bacterium]|nr:F0F1 ATP synthase subunit A [Candidatus Gastranaerophilaceae bacterium]